MNTQSMGWGFAVLLGRAFRGMAPVMVGLALMGSALRAGEWAGSVVGNATQTSWSIQGSAVSLKAATTDIWGRADDAVMIQQELVSDGVLTAKVDSFVATHEWAKTGLMIRSGTEANAAHAFLCYSYGRGIHIQYRSRTGDASGSFSVSFKPVPKWLRVIRKGTAISFATSQDGVSWTAIPRTLSLPAGKVYAGAVVSSHIASRSAEARLSGLELAQSSAPASSAFTASPETITKGECATLSWSVPNATSVTISPSTEVGGVSGNFFIVSPLKTTTYTLQAQTPAGIVALSRTVTVNSAPVPLDSAPVVAVQRDDLSAILDLDFTPRWWDLNWVVPRSGLAASGFRIQWWPADEPTNVSTLLTPNRRAQIQPLVNGRPYQVRVEKLNARGEVCSQPTLLSVAGGDPSRVDTLAKRMTYFDDFNLPEGAPDELLWNSAYSMSIDPRFRLFFINNQYHAHTQVGTQTSGPGVGDRAQNAQRFRKPMLLESGTKRTIVFDMDGALAPRGVWYLDLMPESLDVSGHVSLDSEGSIGLPASMLRLRNIDNNFDVILVGADGAMHTVGSVELQTKFRQMIPNVRRAFEVQVDTTSVVVKVDGTEVLSKSWVGSPLPAGPYHLLWSGFGYNTMKDNNPYFLIHWDNFGFDGPVLEPRVVHNYVMQVTGMDYQDASRNDNKVAEFSLNIPDQLAPTKVGTTAEAWLVFTYQIGNYNSFSLLPGDRVEVNGAAYALPAPVNNASPKMDNPVDAVRPNTVRLKLGDLTSTTNSSNLKTGANLMRFFAQRTGILNLHVEMIYAKDAAPAYTPPGALFEYPAHHDMLHVGPPARIEQIGSQVVEAWRGDLDNPSNYRAVVKGRVPVIVLAGGELTTNAPIEGMMAHPSPSAEIWSMGTTTGIDRVELYIRKKGTTGRGVRIGAIQTASSSPAPQTRLAFELDTTKLPNGDYEVFPVATNHHGIESYPNYAGSGFHYDATEYSGGYYPINVTITN